MQLDYQSQEWMLLQNEQVVARSIPFKDTNLVTLSRFKALQAGLVAREDPTDRVAYFDDFQLSNTEPAGLDFDQDGLLNSLERSLQSDPFSRIQTPMAYPTLGSTNLVSIYSTKTQTRMPTQT